LYAKRIGPKTIGYYPAADATEKMRDDAVGPSVRSAAAAAATTALGCA